MAKIIEGWLVKYGQPSQPIELPSGRKVFEVIAQDAFRASVDAINAGAAAIEANIEHVDDAICRIGLSGKNVKVENRPEGVYATVTLLDDTLSQDVFEKANARIVDGLSVEFNTPAGVEPTYSLTAGGDYVRTLRTATLTGFAICVDPMYPDARIIAATETAEPAEPATFKRSLSAADVAALAAEIARIEDRGARARDYFERYGFLLGIGR